MTGAEQGPLRPSRTKKLKQDLQRCKKRGYDMAVARVVMGRLIHQEPLESHHRDHPLKGEWEGHRERHLKPDWILIYRIHGNEITFERTGTHSDLFDE